MMSVALFVAIMSYMKDFPKLAIGPLDNVSTVFGPNSQYNMYMCVWMLELSLDTSLNINQSPWYPYFFKYHPEQEKKSTPIYPSHQALKSYEPKTNHWSWPKHPKIQFPIDPGSPHILGPKEVSMFSRPCTTWTYVTMWTKTASSSPTP